MRKALGRSQFQRQVLAGAEAGIYGQHNRKRQGRFLVEDRKLLVPAVFSQLEVIFFQTRGGRAVLVSNGDKNIHQFDVNFNGCVGLLRESTHDGGQNQAQGGEVSHGENVHLDARPPKGVPWARGISAGKGSPSAQTAPSSKYSFFQMGTVRLRVSISQRQASKAAPRCAEATTIRTLVSPISSFPKRCTMATS